MMKNNFYKITAPDTGSVNYLIATTEVDSPRHKREIAEEIANTPVFKQAQILISESGYREDIIEHLLIDLAHRVGLDIDQNNDPADDQSDESLVEPDNNADQNDDVQKEGDEINPHLDNWENVKFIVEHLKVLAHKNHVPIVPLQTQQSLLRDQASALKKIIWQPKNLFFAVTAPVSLPILGIHNAYETRQLLKENYQDYTSGNFDHLTNNKRLHTRNFNGWREKRVQRWLTQGYDGEWDNPTKGGLENYLRHNSDAVIALNAYYVFNVKNSKDDHKNFLEQLQDRGFTVEQVDSSYDPSSVEEYQQSPTLST